MLRFAALALALMAVVLAPLGAAGAVAVPVTVAVADCSATGVTPVETPDHGHRTAAKGSAEGHCLHVSVAMALVGAPAAEHPRMARRSGLEPPSDAPLHGLIVSPPRHPPKG